MGEVKAMKLIFLAICLLTPYNRKDYKHWSDFDGDGFDTRAEILIDRSLCRVSLDSKRVVTGCWLDAYSGAMLYFADDVQIDHVVALKEAHEAGAVFFSPKKKEQFANDMENLVITFGRINQEKSAHPPHEWFPPRKDRAEWYRKKRFQIMRKWGLRPTVDEAEFYLD